MSALNLITSYGSDSDDDLSNTEITDPARTSDNEEDHGKKTINFFEVIDDEEKSDSELGECSSTKMPDSSNSLDNPFRPSYDNQLSASVLPSVFVNPFKNAEEAEKSVLEKHVKLAPKLEDIKEINGRKICWNYRKGRCRFGSNCVFAHDSELQHTKQIQQKVSSNWEPKCNNAEYSKKRQIPPNVSVPPEKVAKYNFQK